MNEPDQLLKLVFDDYKIWEQVIYDSDEKHIRKSILQNMSDPDYRNQLKSQIQNHEYKIKPPHEANIPKDDGSMRTVYVNEPEDRVFLSVINNIFFKHCKHMIHPLCQSYQTGIGCGKIVRQVVEEIQKINFNSKYIGYKIDLSKYFDSVPIQYIDQVFDQIQDQFGASCILDLVREYYHDDVLLDLKKQEIHKYTSLRQGCAIAAFLADAVLYDIDQTMSEYQDIIYYRYSDDILILGNDENADKAFAHISKLLDQKSLTLNPKKIEHLDKQHWFVFLGFAIKDNMISLSKKRIKNLQHEIDTIIKKSSDDPIKIAHSIYRYLYDKSIVPYSYADGILPVINCKQDIKELDLYIMDAIRGKVRGKNKIGGLGFNKNQKLGVIQRGKGRHVASNRQHMPVVNYTTISFMKDLYKNKAVYDAYSQNMIFQK